MRSQVHGKSGTSGTSGTSRLSGMSGMSGAMAASGASVLSEGCWLIWHPSRRSGNAAPALCHGLHAWKRTTSMGADCTHGSRDGEPACRRDSVTPIGAGGHPSVRPTWGSPAGAGGTGSPCPLFGLAPGGVYRAVRVTPDAGALLPHRFTLACAIPLPGPPSAVCSLWHCPSGRPDWLLASTLPCGVPTFLDTVPVQDQAVPRPPGRLTVTSSVPGRAPGREELKSERPGRLWLWL